MSDSANAFIPLVATAVGGILAIVSARLSASSAHNLTLKREHQAKLREKAEELYSLLLRLRHESRQWCNAVASDDFSHVDTGDAFAEHEKERIRMICDLYIPSLSGVAHSFMDAYRDFGSSALYGLTTLANEEALPEDFVAELESKYAAFAEQIEAFRKQLSHLVCEVSQ